MHTRTSSALSIALLLLLAAPGFAKAPEVAPGAPRPHLFGAGIMWHGWFFPDHVNLIPEEYRDNPRSYDQAQLDKIVEMGVTACHGGFGWVDIEKERGTYDWTRADEQVEDVVDRGLTMYAYIGGTPEWAMPAGTNLPPHRTPPGEDYVQEFEDWCEAVARRYKGRVDHFWFWNEPNGCSWVNDGCSNMNGYPLYAKWLKRAYAALKRGNPDCTVGAGVLDYNEGVEKGYEYIEGLYAEGCKDYMDAVVIHPYNNKIEGPSVHWKAIHDTRRVMVENGDEGKPMWINEWGWHASADPRAADLVTEFLTKISSPEYYYVTYTRYLIVTDLPGGGYGLCDRDLTPRPAYTAYKEFDKSMGFPESRPDIFGSGIMWEHWFEGGDNSSGWILPEQYQNNRLQFNRDQLDLIKEMGGNAVWANLDWRILEKTRGIYEWANYDMQIEEINSRGLEPYIFVGCTPDWAKPEEYSHIDGHRVPPAEEYAADFERYVRRVAERYKDKAKYFMFWNEPNGCGWINDGCANGDQYPLYVKWLKRAYTAIKEGNPDAIVGAGVLDYNHTNENGYEYIEGMYAEGAKDYFDAIVIHPYAPGGIHWNAIHDTRRVMVENGDADKPVWIDEWGWSDSSAADAPERLLDFLTKIKQPEYDYVTYCRYLVVSDIPGQGYGLTDTNLAKRPIYEAYKNFDKTFGRTTMKVGTAGSIDAATELNLLDRLFDKDTTQSLWKGAEVREKTDPKTGATSYRIVPQPLKGPGRFPEAEFKGENLDWGGYDELELQFESEGRNQVALLLYEWDGDRRESYSLTVPLVGEGPQTLRFNLRTGPGGDLTPTTPGSDNEWNPDPETGVRLIMVDYPAGFVVDDILLRRAQP